jgi:adenylate cyclase
VPVRASLMGRVEIAAGLLLGAASVAAAALLTPGLAILAALGLALAWVVAAAGLSLGGLWLTDPVAPVLMVMIASQAAALAHFVVTYRQRQAIERRFALHLPPAVVRRIADNPSELKLAGETRTITVLITDIEGFTSLTERAGAEAIVALLDRYIDLVAGIVVAHGGMVDKIVGDAVIAFFNAPLDLEDHAVKAIACARAIAEATEALRASPDMQRLGLGRTRIGIETGSAVLGDVGRGTKRDYTAYGRAVNLASRLEAANKHFGSAIAIGPGTAAAVEGRLALRRLGRLAIRGVEEEVEIFAPA